MAEVKAVPNNVVGPASLPHFLASCRRENTLIYFVLNVGDGDTQILLLPSLDDDEMRRRAIVVDVAKANRKKLGDLMGKLAADDVSLLQRLRSRDQQADRAQARSDAAIPIVVASHPHDDHIGGMSTFIEEFHDDIVEFWEPGYYHPTAAFIEMMKALENNRDIALTQPAAGLRRFVDGVRITVLSPSITLKNRYDSYGVEINNSSIALKFEYPYSRVAFRDTRESPEATRSPGPGDRIYRKIKRVRSLILGGDAQTVAWGNVMNDFPRLEASTSPAFKALKKARGVEPLRANVLKVPHHASKHGVNLELVEAIEPELAIVSSVADGGKYNFPHEVALESIREAVQPTTSKRTPRVPDFELGISYTSDLTEGGDILGSIALVIPTRGDIEMWRFGDERGDMIDLNKARRQEPPTHHD